MLRNCLLIALVSWGFTLPGAYAQDGDIAYVPREAPARTADDVSIDLHHGDEPGIVDLILPVGTFHVDLLNAAGNVARDFDTTTPPQLDLRELRPGTWTIRAHTRAGARVRRFLVLGSSGTMWVDGQRPSSRKR